MGCNCKGKATGISQPVLDELPKIDTPDTLLAKELKDWKEEQHKVMMDDLKRNENENNEPYPLIED